VADAAPDAATPDAATPDAAALDAAAPDAEPPIDCDDSRPPLVMAHGLLAAGDTWAPHVKRFTANGLCADRYHAFDWASLDRSADHDAELLAFIDAVRAQHGVAQVDLMGHSAGGGLGYTFLADADRASRVRRYVHVGSVANDAPAGPPGVPVDMLNVWSEGDLIVDGADIPGAQNAQVPGLDHYAVATAPAAFVEVYRFLYDEDPAVVDAPPALPIRVSGKGLILADNTPEAGGLVEIWPVGADGQRQVADPVATFTVAEDGRFGPFRAEPDQHYEFRLQPARDGAPPVRYYREPFTRSDPLFYLRTLPTAGLAGALLRQVPFDDAHTVLVIFSASESVVAGEDSLTVDGEELAIPELAAAEATTIALFVYDLGTDGVPGGAIAAFAALPFLSAIDRPIPADPAQSLTIRLNDRTLAVPRWPSATEGAVIAVFD
ncbi:MAG: alpha/beta fold hydrolase, partial [Myxococcales bacterium]|nr:alpha/beta fold hydrolase [Myxococcales bacterium]